MIYVYLVYAIITLTILNIISSTPINSVFKAIETNSSYFHIKHIDYLVFNDIYFIRVALGTPHQIIFTKIDLHKDVTLIFPNTFKQNESTTLFELYQLTYELNEQVLNCTLYKDNAFFNKNFIIKEFPFILFTLIPSMNINTFSSVGLSHSYSNNIFNIPFQLKTNNNITSQMFSFINYNSPTSYIGKLVFGDFTSVINQYRRNFTMKMCKIISNKWCCSFKHIAFDNKKTKLMNSIACFIMNDKFIYAPKNVFDNVIVKAFEKYINLNICNVVVNDNAKCIVCGQCDELIKKMEIGLGTETFEVKNLFSKNIIEKNCLFNIRGKLDNNDDDNVWWLGTMFHKENIISFDYENNAIMIYEVKDHNNEGKNNYGKLICVNINIVLLVFACLCLIMFSLFIYN